MQFVDMWILEHITFLRVPIELLLLDIYSLREQWNSRCRGITPARVRRSLLELYGDGKVVLYKDINKDDELDADDQVPATEQDVDLLAGGAMDEIARAGMVVQRTVSGFTAWSEWKDFDWNNYSSFQNDRYEFSDLRRLSTIEIFAATSHKLLHEIQHAPELHGIMIDAGNLSCEVTSTWVINEAVTLPWCYHIRTKGRELNVGSDEELAKSEKATEGLCKVLKDSFLQWELEGRLQRFSFEPGGIRGDEGR
jgi:hypothetical protein